MNAEKEIGRLKREIKELDRGLAKTADMLGIFVNLHEELQSFTFTACIDLILALGDSIQDVIGFDKEGFVAEFGSILSDDSNISDGLRMFLEKVREGQKRARIKQENEEKGRKQPKC